MMNDRGNKNDLFLTFASLSGEVTGRLPTEAQNKKSLRENVNKNLYIYEQHHRLLLLSSGLSCRGVGGAVPSLRLSTVILVK